MRTGASIAVAAAILLAVSCGQPPGSNPAADVRTFLTDANSTMHRLAIEQSRAGWIQQTFITDDTEALSALANRRFIDAVARLAKGATAFDNVSVSAEERRQLDLLKHSLVMVAPSDAKESEELTNIAAKLESTYGKGTFCQNPDKPETCLNIDGVRNVMATSRDEARLRTCGRAGTPFRHRCAPATRDSWSCRTRARGRSGSLTAAPCGAPSTTCRRTTSRRSSIGCGTRCARCTSSCTPTCA